MVNKVARKFKGIETFKADKGVNIIFFFPFCTGFILLGKHLLPEQTYSSKKFQHICVSLDVNFNKSLTNDVVSFEQLGPGVVTHTTFWKPWFEATLFTKAG